MQNEPLLPVGAKLQLMFQVSVLLFQPALGANKCLFPKEWRGDGGQWYVQYKRGPPPQAVSKHFVHNQYESFFQHSDSGANNYIATYICLGLREKHPYHYVLMHNSDQREDRKCVRVRTHAGYNSPRDLLIYTSLNTGPLYTDVNACQKHLFPEYVDISVEWPLSLQATDCPFAVGKYQVEVKLFTSSRELTFCQNNMASHITVGQTHIEINSCLQGNTYSDPFTNVKLDCYREIAPLRVGSQAGFGLLHIFAFNLTKHGTQFFVARYKIYDYGVIKISLQGSKLGKIRLRLDLTFDSVGSDENGFYHQFYLTPFPTTTSTTTTTTTTTTTESPYSTISAPAWNTTSSLSNATAGNMSLVSYTGDPTTTLPWIPGGGATRGPGNPGSPDNAENDRITAQTQTALNTTLTGAAILMVILLAVVFILANVCVTRRHKTKQRPGKENIVSNMMKTPSEILRTKKHQPLTPVETPNYDISVIPYINWKSESAKKKRTTPKDSLRTASQLSLDSRDSSFSEVSLPV